MDQMEKKTKEENEKLACWFVILCSGCFNNKAENADTDTEKKLGVGLKVKEKVENNDTL
ncbi:MAG: hypothetical protein OXC44_02675 [Proteobacteria bacterium]|nr:hypothetical protein [Pseudomonadota bacterium]